MGAKGVELFTEELLKAVDGTLAPKERASEFWEPMTENVKAFLAHVRDELAWPEPKSGIVLFGELYGTQDMKYGLKNARGFRAFDLAVNGRYVDFDVKKALLEKFSVEMVPTIYRGPYDVKLVEQHTDGPTTMCARRRGGVRRARGNRDCAGG